MGNERDLKLQSYNISENRYRELKYFCRQYREKQSQLRSMTELPSPGFGGTRGGRTSDRTAEMAIKRVQLQKDLESIEQAAMEADPEIHQYIISNVADGIPYIYLGVPCSESTFKRRRRKFFKILDEKKS